MGNAERGNNEEFRQAHEHQVNRYLDYAKNSVRETRGQMLSARANVHQTKIKKAEIGEQVRLRLAELSTETLTNKQVQV